MDLTHSFTVPAGVEETWRTFTDIADVANCFPGATVTSAEGDTFKGTVKIKLGPISLLYNGAGTFVERDEAAHRFVVEAKGKDKRGNGTAGATVTASMSEAGEGRTEVTVLTDLSITGKPAQFGRGMIEDVSNKLLDQFVACLESRVGAPPAPAEEAAAPAHEPSPIEREAAAAAAAATGGGMTAPPAEAQPSPPRAPREEQEALDLGATVLPILLKSYWKQIAAGLLVLLVLRRLLRRRR
ncbi:MAG TPA: SRPBCC family protein [Nocardioidaceae bacterium]